MDEEGEEIMFNSYLHLYRRLAYHSVWIVTKKCTLKVQNTLPTNNCQKHACSELLVVLLILKEKAMFRTLNGGLQGKSLTFIPEGTLV